jgi:hypothetical protein
MSHAETYLVKGAQLYERICSEAASRPPGVPPPTKVLLSFDLFCLLAEYAALVEGLQKVNSTAMHELLAAEDLILDTGTYQLVVRIDFFLPPNTIHIS